MNANKVIEWEVSLDLHTETEAEPGSMLAFVEAKGPNEAIGIVLDSMTLEERAKVRGSEAKEKF